MGKFFVPFTRGIPHEPQPLWEFYANGWGELILLSTVLLGVWGLYLLFVCRSWSTAFLFQSLCSLPAIIALHGTIYAHWALVAILGDASLPANFLPNKIYQITMTAYFGGYCYLLLLFLSVLVLGFTFMRTHPEKSA
jgi:hypothetical protein